MSSSSSSTEKKRKAIIIGGGIAGASVGILLQRVGIDCEVFEADKIARNEIGAFVNIGPNGLHCLEVIGLDGAKLSDLPTKAMTFSDHTLKPICTIEMQSFNIMRGELNKNLHALAVSEGVKMNMGKRLVDVKLAPTEVIAIFEDGSEAKGDFLVGCDGIHSVTRKIVFPEAPPPLYSGIVGSGGMVNMPELASTNEVINMVFGMENFFGFGVTDKHDVYWWNNQYMQKAPTKEELYRLSTEEWFQQALIKHKNDAHPIPEIIQATKVEFVRWPIYNLPDLEKWHKGRVCLTGDAAHAVAPHGGQGASMAMEDAIVLAQCLRDYGDIEEAFEKFQNARYERVTTIAGHARRAGSRKTASSWLSRFVRGLILPFFMRMAAGITKTMHDYRADPTFSLKRPPQNQDESQDKIELPNESNNNNNNDNIITP